MAGEAVVYDKRTNDAHVLGATTAAVWQLCGGQRRRLAGVGAT